MCSNTSSSGGVSGGGGGGGDGDGDYASLLLKKPKRQKVPKRGPGVAELEKILREQENTNTVDKDKIEGFSSSCRFSPFSNSYHPRSSVMSSSISDRNQFCPPAPHMTMLHGNGGKSTVLGGGNGGHIGGSSMVLPEQGLFPWSSCCEPSIIYGESPKFPVGYPFSADGSSDHMHHFPVMLQKKPCQYSSPSTINLFPHSGSSLSSSDGPSAGFYLHLEPPSNQRSHQNYTTVLPEEEKMAAMKRPRSFDVDSTMDPPPFHFQVSPHYTAFNLKQNETVSRDHAKPGGHFLLFGSAATPPHTPQTSQQEFSKHNSLPFQETSKKPFFSFLIPEEQIGEAETSLTLNSERGRTRGEAIDLNLKL